MSALALLGAASCGDNVAPTSNDELQALLHDEPLTQISIAALAAPGSAGSTGTDSDGGVVTGTGNAAGSGMTAGAGGSVGTDGGVATGTGGKEMVGAAGTTGSGGAIVGVGGTIGSGGRAGTTGMGGRPSFGSTLGQWSFDRCNPFRTNLFDDSFQDNDAFRSISVACAEGIGGQSVALADKNEDLVYVPDQPNFDFSTGLTVAGWFNHTAINNTRTLFRKRDDASSSAFALVLNNQKYEFVVNLGSKAVSVVSPKKAKVDTWTHVAASYDGNTLRLYIDGILVVAKGMVTTGTIVPAAGPFLMGNDGSKRLMSGRIDQAFLASRALSDADVRALTCLRQPATITGTPAVSAPTPAGVPVAYDIAITNHDTPACAPTNYFFEVNFVPGVSVEPTFQQVDQVLAGDTRHLTMTATASDDLDAGTVTIPFLAFNPQNGQATFGSVDLVNVVSGCRVSTGRELMITNLGVVDDPRAQGSGAWSFKHLMEEMAPTAEDAPAMVEEVLRSFLTDTTVNGFTTGPRPGMQFLIDAWPRTSDNKLDLAQPPLQLQAIVNRFDLRNLANGDAGEGRFVFGFLNPFAPPGFPLQATLIFEYKLPAATPEDVLGWANAWHGLGTMTPGSTEYNAALQAITDRFNSRGARPSHPNGNAINAVRTNEIDFGDNGIWQLREFVLSSSTNRLVPATIKLTPDLGFNRTATLASFINANEAAIIAETHDVPEQFQGAPFLAGAVLNDFGTTWQAAGINNNEARHHFALNTCNGCHSIETNVAFLQVSPRFPGNEAFLSGFLTGTTVQDPVTGQLRQFNDLARRRADLKAQVCPPDTMMPPPPGPGTGGAGGRGPIPVPMSAARLGTLTKGISRVH